MNWRSQVTSLAEVWIEIDFYKVQDILDEVTSLAEVWIEIKQKDLKKQQADGHFPCGSVD